MAKKTLKVEVCILCKNELVCLKKIYKKIKFFLDKIKINFFIIDASSTDGSKQFYKENRIEFYTQKNNGRGNAIIEAIKLKKNVDSIIFFSPDGNENIKDVSNTINQKNNFFIIDKYVYDNFKLVNKKFEKNIVSVLKPNEKIKTLDTVEKVASELVIKGANRHSNIRAGLAFNSNIASLIRKHNDANVLVLPGRFIDIHEAIKCVDNFLNTRFEGGRHKNRVNKI